MGTEKSKASSLQMTAATVGSAGSSSKRVVREVPQATGRVAGKASVTWRAPITRSAASPPAKGLPSAPCPSARASEADRAWGPLSGA